MRKETRTKSRSLERLRTGEMGEEKKTRREKEALGKAWEIGAVCAEGKSKTE